MENIKRSEKKKVIQKRSSGERGENLAPDVNWLTSENCDHLFLYFALFKSVDTDPQTCPYCMHMDMTECHSSNTTPWSVTAAAHKIQPEILHAFACFNNFPYTDTLCSREKFSSCHSGSILMLPLPLYIEEPTFTKVTKVFQTDPVITEVVVKGEPAITKVTRVIEGDPSFTKVTRVIAGEPSVTKVTRVIEGKFLNA